MTGPRLGGAFGDERLGDGVDLGDVEGSTGSKKMRHDLCPAGETREPAEHASGRVDDVEFSLQEIGQQQDVRADEARVHAGLAGQVGRDGYRTG